MDDHKILITGDYWHEDFRDVLSQMRVPATLVSLKSIRDGNTKTENYEVVLLAQARPDQFSHQDSEMLQKRFPHTPVVSLVGSWCEGEMRSGNPAGGGVRIFWHQWQGRYDNFVSEFNRSHVSNWHLPRTATETDRVAKSVTQFANSKEPASRGNAGVLVGISAWSEDGYQMLADALQNFDFRCSWLEGPGANTVTPDVICINGNSLSTNLQTSIAELKRRMVAPMVVLMNFPRKSEVDNARKLGVREVVSKPYQLIDLKFAIERAMSGESAAVAS